MPDEKRPNILVIWGDDIGTYILEVEREGMER
jgi:arylsulfatase A-like enzyme